MKLEHRGYVGEIVADDGFDFLRIVNAGPEEFAAVLFQAGDDPEAAFRDLVEAHVASQGTLAGLRQALDYLSRREPGRPR